MIAGDTVPIDQNCIGVGNLGMVPRARQADAVREGRPSVLAVAVDAMDTKINATSCPEVIASHMDGYAVFQFDCVNGASNMPFVVDGVILGYRVASQSDALQIGVWLTIEVVNSIVLNLEHVVPNHQGHA